MESIDLTPTPASVYKGEAGRHEHRGISHILDLFPNSRNSQRAETPLLFHLKMVAKIALSVSALACAGLLSLLFLLADQGGDSYGQIIGLRSLAGQNLGPALLVFGLALLAFAGVVTWAIALYSSFRIAGPLYRFAQNLEMEIDHGPAEPVAIRRTDQLQREWKEFEASMGALHRHFSDLRQALAQTERALQAGAEFDAVSLRQTVARLQDVERRVQL